MALARLDIPPSDVLDLESDLASVASRAAVELDERILGRAPDMSKLARLSELLSLSVADVTNASSPSSALNPTTAVVLRRAMPSGDKMTRLDELLNAAKRLVERFNALSNPPDPTREELEDLRKICVELSRQALSERPSPLEKPGPAFRH